MKEGSSKTRELPNDERRCLYIHCVYSDVLTSLGPDNHAQILHIFLVLIITLLDERELVHKMGSVPIISIESNYK